MKKILYFLSFLLLLASCSGKKDDKTISIGYINWDDGIALTYLTEVILEQQGYHVVFKECRSGSYLCNNGPWQSRFADGCLVTGHTGRLYETIRKESGILGKIYPDARIGLVVPDYVDIHSIDQLNANKEKFGGGDYRH